MESSSGRCKIYTRNREHTTISLASFSENNVFVGWGSIVKQRAVVFMNGNSVLEDEGLATYHPCP